MLSTTVVTEHLPHKIVRVMESLVLLSWGVELSPVFESSGLLDIFSKYERQFRVGEWSRPVAIYLYTRFSACYGANRMAV